MRRGASRETGKFDACHQADAAHVADMGVVAHRAAQGVQQDGSELGGVLDHVFFLDDVEIGQCYGRANRMAGIGKAVHHRAFLFGCTGKHLPHAVRDDRGGHREIGARQALGERDDIGAQPVGAAAEPLAGAPEAGDHLIRDQQDVVAGQHLLHAGEIPLGRKQHAAGTHDGFRDEGGNRVGTFAGDHLFQFRDQAVGKGRLGLALVGEGEMMRAGGVQHA